MGNFRSDNRGGFGNRSSGRSGGRSSGSFGGRDRFGGRGRFDRDRDSDGFGRRRPLEMHDVTCDKCGKQCQVPFKPTGDKPVFCSDCFRKNEGPSGSGNKQSQSGMSSEQFNKLNVKLDKILKVLENLEIDYDDSEEDSDEEDKDSEDNI